MSVTNPPRGGFYKFQIRVFDYYNFDIQFSAYNKDESGFWVINSPGNKIFTIWVEIIKSPRVDLVRRISYNIHMNNSQDNTKSRVLKKLKLLADHQKFEQVLAKENDKMEEVRGNKNDQEEVAKIKQKLLKK